VKASYDSMKGPVSSHWKKTRDSYFMNVVIPHNALGKIIIPRHDTKYTSLYHRDGTLLLDISNHQVGETVSLMYNGIRDISTREDGSIELNVQSGSFGLHARI